MPRMSKSKKLEWSFFLNDRGRMAYNVSQKQEHFFLPGAQKTATNGRLFRCYRKVLHRLAAAIAAVSHRTGEDVMKNLFQIEHRIAAVYSLAALHAGGRILHQRQAAIWVAA